MDRFDDMRARVSGGGASGGSFYGVEVLAQATENFDEGDTFVGTAVSGMTPTTARVLSGLQNVGHVSADNSVALSNVSITATSTIATIYIKNGDVYTAVNVPLPDMTGATSCTTTYGEKKVSINEDGTIIVLNMKAFLLKIDVNKGSLTATASRIEISSVSLSNYPYTVSNVSYDVTPVDFNTNHVLVRGSYLFFVVKGSYIQSTSTKNVYYTMYGRIVGSSITHEYLLSASSSAVNIACCSSVLNYGGNDLIFAGGNALHRLEISGGVVVKHNMISQTLSYITMNGKYALNSATIYTINKGTGTCTLVASSVSTSTVYGIDETGQYIETSAKCYRLDGTALGPALGTAGIPAGSDYFKVVDDSYIDNSYYTTTLVPSAEAEYTIAHTTSVSTAGDIYGVVTDSMTMGETKKALKIFNK